MHWKFALLLVSVLFSLSVAELGLRVAGFQFDLAPESVEFGFPNPQQMKDFYRPDPDLFWVTRDYDSRLRRLERADLPAPDIIFMGDSVTEPRWSLFTAPT
jgi:hypothetical protein